MRTLYAKNICMFHSCLIQTYRLIFILTSSYISANDSSKRSFRVTVPHNYCFFSLSTTTQCRVKHACNQFVVTVCNSSCFQDSYHYSNNDVMLHVAEPHRTSGTEIVYTAHQVLQILHCYVFFYTLDRRQVVVMVLKERQIFLHCHICISFAAL